MQTNLISKELINNEELNLFYSLLENSSIKPNDKKAFRFAIEFMEGKHDISLSSKSFLLTGEPGVGKTHLVECFLKIFNLPVIFSGCTTINHKFLVNCKELSEVIRRIDKIDRFIVFIDDLSYVFKYSEYQEISSEDRKDFMKIADMIKSSSKRVLFFATANESHFLDDSMLDRIDIKVEVDIPVEQTKISFLQARYSNMAAQKQLKYLAKHSLGYNFRDLPEVIKMAYRNGDGKISSKNLNNAIRDYVPTSMQRYHVLNNIRINFAHVIGKEKIKEELHNIIISIKKRNLARKLGLKRHNLLVFDGPVGTGKTFMVKALAGELKFPIINIKARDFMSCHSYRTIESIGNFAKRFENCIVFVDEAEKMIGRHSMDEDSNFDGQLNQIFDGIDSISNALVIIAVNNSMRFGMGFWDRFAVIRFEMPNLSERRDFIRSMISKTRIKADYDELARATEGMSFRDLEKLCNNVFYKILRGTDINNSTFYKAVKSLKSENLGMEMYG